MYFIFLHSQFALSLHCVLRQDAASLWLWGVMVCEAHEGFCRVRFHAVRRGSGALKPGSSAWQKNWNDLTVTQLLFGRDPTLRIRCLRALGRSLKVVLLALDKENIYFLKIWLSWLHQRSFVYLFLGGLWFAVVLSGSCWDISQGSLKGWWAETPVPPL